MMRKLNRLAGGFALTLFFALSVFAGTWYRAVSVTGGSAQRLSTVMVTGGYAGPYGVLQLTVCNPDAAANTLYVGQSDVSAVNGFPLLPGECYTDGNGAGTVDLTQIFLFTATTQNAEIAARSF